MHLSDQVNEFLNWARSKGLEAVLIVLGSILLSRGAHYLAGRVSRYLGTVATHEIRDELILSERNKHVAAIVQVMEWASVAILYSVAFVLVLIRFEVPITSLVAPATVVGLALGFGAQRVVQDLLAGFFIFAERQYGIGDIIRIGPPGTLTGISGTVEEVTLRITRIRTPDGEQVILPNSEIRQVVNSSREWSQVVVDFPVRQSADLAQVKAVLGELSSTMNDEEAWAKYLVGPIMVSGVEAIAAGVATLRILAKTIPTQQWDVAREIRIRGLAKLGEMGVLYEPGNMNTNYGA